MAKQVDQRVVQMQFDNQKFEQGVQSTLKSINKLDQSLGTLNNVSIKGLDKLGEIASRINFDTLADAADAAAHRMSSLGVVGATVLSNITTEAMNAAKTLANMTIGQITTGGKNRALNLEQAKFQLEGLGVAWDQISPNINAAVEDTAYGLDAAAKVASQLVASNVQVGEDMERALTAVSGVAAMTNRSYDEIGAIFTTVAGNGRLMGMQLTQLSSKGLNVAASLAKSMGKSEQEIREMVSKGKIDFKTFSDAMYDAFAAHAKEANKTFSGSLSNMKAALSRVGAAFYEPGLAHARDIFNSITVAVKQFKTSLEQFGIVKDVDNIMIGITKHVTEFFNSLGGESPKLNQYIGGALQTLHNALGAIGNMINNGSIVQGLKSISQIAKMVVGALKAAFAGIKEVFPIDVVHTVIHYTEVLKERLEGVGDLQFVYNRIQNTFKGIASLLKAVLKIIGAIWKIVRPAFSKIGSALGDLLVKTSRWGQEISKWQDGFKPYEKWGNKIAQLGPKIENLKTTFNNSMKSINDTFKKHFGKDIPDTLKSIKEKFLGIFKKDKENEEGLKNTIDWFGLLEAVIEKVAQGIQILINLAGILYNTFAGNFNILDKVGTVWQNLIGGFNAFIAFLKGADIGEVFEKELSPGLAEFLMDFRDVFNNIKTIVKDAFKAFKPVLKGFMDGLKNLKFDDIMKSGGLALAIVGVKKLIDGLLKYRTQMQYLKKLKEGGAAFAIDTELQKITGMFGSIKGFFDQLKTSLKETTVDKQLLNVARAVALLAVSMLIVSSIDKDKINQSLASITLLLGEVFGVMYGIEKNIRLYGLEIGKIAGTLLAIAIAVGILASALKKLSRIDPEKIGQSIVALTVIFVELGAMLWFLNKYIQWIPEVAKSLLALGVAIRLIAGAMNVFAKMDTAGLIKGIVGVGAILAEILAFTLGLKELKLMKTLQEAAVGLIALAIAINLLMIPVLILSHINGERLAQGLLGLAVILAEIAGFAYIIKKTGVEQFAGVAASLILIAVAVNMLMIPLAIMAGLGNRLESALLGMAVLLTEIGAFAKVINDSGVDSFLKLGASLIILAVAMNLLMIPLAVMAGLGDKLPQALLGMAAVLTMLALFATVLDGADGLLKTAAAMVIFAAAMNMLMIPLATMAAMKTENLIKAIAAFAVLLVLMGAMAAVMGALSGAAAGILAIGVALLLVGAAVALVGVGLAGIGAAIWLVVAAFKMLVETLLEVGTGLVNLAITLAFAIVAFITTIANAGPQLAEAGAQLIIALCDAILKASPKVCDTSFQVIVDLLKALTEHAPEILSNLLELVFKILDGLLKGLTDKVPVLARDLYNFCMTILDETIKLMKQTPMDLVDIFFGGGFKEDKNQGKKLGEWFDGLFKKNKDSEEVKQAGEDTAEAVVDSTADALGSAESQDKMDNALDGLVSGAGEKLLNNNKLAETMGSVADGSIEGFEAPFDISGGESGTMADIAGFANQGFLSGAESGLGDIYNMGSKTGNSYLSGVKDATGVHSPSTKAMAIAKFIDEGFGLGFKNSHMAEDEGNKKAVGLMRVFDTVGSFLRDNDMSKQLDGLDVDYQPTITPVMDMSGLNSGFAAMDAMFSTRRSLALAGDAAFIQDENRRLSLAIQNDNSDNMNGGFSAIGDKLDRLGTAIMNRQIVLDTGEVVGGLAEPMDQALGVRMIMSQRERGR